MPREAPHAEHGSGLAHSGRQAEGTNQLPGRVHLQGERAYRQGEIESQLGVRTNQLGERVHLQRERTNQLPKRILHLGVGSKQQGDRSSQQGEKANHMIHQLEEADCYPGEMIHQLNNATMIHQLRDKFNQQVENLQLTEQVRQYKEPSNQPGDGINQLGETASQNAKSIPHHHPHQPNWRVCRSAAHSPEEPFLIPEAPRTPADQTRVLEPTRVLPSPIHGQQRQDQCHSDQSTSEQSLSEQATREKTQSEHAMIEQSQSEQVTREHSQSELAMIEQSQSEQVTREQSQSEHSAMEQVQSQHAVRVQSQSEHSDGVQCQILVDESLNQSEHSERNQSECVRCQNPSECVRGQSQSELERDQNQSECDRGQSQWERREHLRETQVKTQWEEPDAYERRGGDQESTDTHQERPQQQLERPQQQQEEFMMDRVPGEREKEEQFTMDRFPGQREREEKFMMDRVSRERDGTNVPQSLNQYTGDMSQSPSHPNFQSTHWQRDGMWVETGAQAMPLATQNYQSQGFLQAPPPCKSHHPEKTQPGAPPSWPQLHHQATPTPLTTPISKQATPTAPTHFTIPINNQATPTPLSTPISNQATPTPLTISISNQATPTPFTIPISNQATPTPLTTTISNQTTPTPLPIPISRQGTPTPLPIPISRQGTPTPLPIPISQQGIPTPLPIPISQQGTLTVTTTISNQATPTPVTTPPYLNTEVTHIQTTPPNQPPPTQVTPTYSTPTNAPTLLLLRQASVGSRLHHYHEQSDSESDGEAGQWDGTSPITEEEEPLANQNALMEETAGMEPVTPNQTAGVQSGLSNYSVGIESLPSHQGTEEESVLPNQAAGMEHVLSNQSVRVESVLPNPSTGVECVLSNQTVGVESVRDSGNVVSQAIKDIREAIEEVKQRAVRSPYTPDLPSEPVWVMRPPSPKIDKTSLYHCNSQSDSNLLFHSQSPNQSDKNLLFHCLPPTQSESNLLFHCQPPTQSDKNLLFHCQPPTQSDSNLLFDCQSPTQSEKNLLYHCQPPFQSDNNLLFHSQPPAKSDNSLLYHCNPQSEDNLLYRCQPTTQSHTSSPYHRPPLSHADASALLQCLQEEHPIPEAFAPLGKESLNPRQLCDVTDSSPVHYEEEPPRSLASLPSFVDVPGPCDPVDLIDGVLFAAVYLGCTQLLSERNPSKNSRMQQAQEAMSRVRAVAGDPAAMVEVDLFLSTQRIKVLNTETQGVMLDQPLRTVSYIADIGDTVVLMARRKMIRSRSAQDQLDSNHTPDCKRHYRMICHVFQSEDAQLIAQAIGQTFTVAYQEFLRANGIDPEDLSQREYSELLNTQDMYNDDLIHFSKSENCRDVYIEKQKGEILGVVIVESGWGSILPTVIIASMMQSGPAVRSGRLNIGDQIMIVNGTSLVGLPLNTCQSIIKGLKSQSRVKMNIVRCPPVTMVLIRRPDLRYQLGFSVQNGIICSLMRGGIAERGGVRVGHRIIEIDSQSVVATPHEKIVYILSNAVGEIHMKTMPAAMYRLLTGQEQPVYI
ncbi:uncharacterized protein LOC121698386 isoform X2 [Alosa sapidissima]|uniref:uncharacterized protein LOC121698386 isoform X2 n=1 Tax=Alosa sapidissima TaxID=34773 RepID=UPI001C09B9BB|nr:uncharacterized protein LOC121698386 isoform X2 [Alosa sapidissima]